MSYPAEFALLAASVAGRTEATRRAATGAALCNPSLEWGRVLAAVHRHRMAGFLHRALKDAGVEPPTEVAGELRVLAASDARAALRVAAEAVRLVRLMQAQHLPVMVLKGPAVAASLHGELSVRQSKDLDLLVPPDRIDEAMRLCEAAGYVRVGVGPGVDDPDLRLWLRHQKDVCMLSRRTGVLLELHVRPSRNIRQSQRLDLWTAPDLVLLGGEAHVPAPGRESLYAYLCTHGAAHAWGRLKWLADVAAMTDAASDDEIRGLHQSAVDRGAGRASGQALLLIRRVWRRDLPDDLARELDMDGRLQRLERLAWSVLTDPREAGDVPFRSMNVKISMLLLEDGWTHRLAEMRPWLFDWGTVSRLRLPRPLWGLYSVLKLPAFCVRKLTAAARVAGRHLPAMRRT